MRVPAVARAPHHPKQKMTSSRPSNLRHWSLRQPLLSCLSALVAVSSGIALPGMPPGAPGHRWLKIRSLTIYAVSKDSASKI